MLIQCTSCAKKLNVPDTAAGKKARCPACKTVFDILAATTPAVPAAPLPARHDDDDADARPRRRAREEDEEDEDRPGRHLRDEDDEDRPDAPRAPSQSQEDDDDTAARATDARPMPVGGKAVNGGAASVAAQAGAVARWLRLAALVLIVTFIIGLISQYLVADAELASARKRRNVPLPGDPYTVALIAGLLSLLILGPCVAFMLIGAGNARKLKGRGLVMTGLIIAIVLGFLSIFGVITQALMLMLNFHYLRIVQLAVSLGTTAILLIAGFRGLSIMGRPAMTEAFGVPARRPPPRGRARPEPDDEDFDDEDEDDYDDRAARRRRRQRDDD